LLPRKSDFGALEYYRDNRIDKEASLRVHQCCKLPNIALTWTSFQQLPEDKMQPMQEYLQEPGGWNRVILQVSDVPVHIEALKKAGLHFWNEMEVGPGGKQIQLEDPDGNPIELFEPVSRP
jgi:predicted enzyme related to lactoylglutathione lyase